MFHHHRGINWILSIVFVASVASCDGLGAGCGCAIQPLPPGGLPADQTIEGGAQIRVTSTGFDKLTSIIPTVINDALGDGICIPRSEVFDVVGTSATVCGNNEGGCSPGCPVSFSIDETNINASGQNLNIQVQFDLHVDVHIDYSILFIPGSCNADIDLQDGYIDIDVDLGIDEATGELTIGAADINTLDLTNLSLNGCGVIGDIVDAALDLITDVLLFDVIIDLFTPLLNDLFQGLLPDPLGIEGMIDMGALIGAVSPGTNATMEMRGVPGGFVDIVNSGLTLGVILGVNADEDLDTRTPELDNEPAYCVPPVTAPDFSADPASLPTSARGTFILSAADDFRGVPEPDADIAIGVSETTLDLLGHHAFTSGGLCLGIGPQLVPQLNLGLIGILVPSFSELGSDEGDDPLLLVTRPIKALDFTIGEGTENSPSLTLHLQEFEIDFYAYIFERYVRGFTVRLSMDVGVNIEFTTTDTGAPAILPVLTGLDANAIEVTALNSEFLRETDDTLAATLPSILDLALPLITSGLGEIELPNFAGFTLGDLQMARVVTSEDEFLSITASLSSAAPFMRQLADKYPSVRDVIGEDDAQPIRAMTRATLRSVKTPTPEVLRAGLRGQPNGAVPQVIIDVEPVDALGRQLEWTWNIDGGMWRPFTQETPLVIDTPMLAWQSDYNVEIAARVVGDYRTMDLDPVIIPVTIDSVGPRIHVDRARLRDGAIDVPVSDLVSPHAAIEIAFGHPDDSRPTTAWMRTGRAALALDDAGTLAKDGPNMERNVVVYARDKRGNTTKALIDISTWLPFHGSSEGSGCNCAAGTTDAGSMGGFALLFALTMIVLAARGRRRGLRPLMRSVHASGMRAARAVAGKLPMWAIVYGALGIGMSMMPACDCGGVDVPTCELSEECDSFCFESSGEGYLGVCLDGMCLCQDDVPWGRFGQYSEMALSPSGTVWVSAYNSTYGDLTVASTTATGPIAEETWQFIDGVPNGPVVVERSTRRGGIEAPGPDVGKYTSIVVNDLEEVMVSYFDEDNASLKMIANFGGVWESHTVATGNPSSDPELGYAIVGQYSSITIDRNTGRPGIAYFGHFAEGGNVRTQVLFASAQTPNPRSEADWITYEVDSIDVTDPVAEDPLHIPNGLGLFIDSARQTDGTPAVVYYDRKNGNLKLARFNLTDGVFDPEVLDGNNGTDVGWYPSVAIDANNDAHVSYVSATSDDLMYINTLDRTPEIVDDGYRLVGTTEDGLPKPEFHLVGDDSNIVLTNLGPIIVYQDATVHELLRSRKNGSGLWEFSAIAGDEQEFAGGYGFYASADFDGQELVISSWVIDQPMSQAWVEIFREFVIVQ